MAFVPYFGTGWETGLAAMTGTPYLSEFTLQTAQKKTGSYSIGTAYNGGTFWADYDGSSSVDIGIWVYIGGNAATGNKIGIYLSDGNILYLQWNNSTKRFDFFINAASTASGSINVSQNVWVNIQIRASIANAGGYFQTKIGGVADINFSGDTQPGAVTDISSVRLHNDGGNDTNYFDDFVFGSGGWPGDQRFDGLVTNGDTATEQWSLSTGADSYALVDEIPPNTTDYIYSSTNGQQTLMDMANWSSSGKTPIAVILWSYTWKTAATGDQIKLLLKSGVTLDTSAAKDLDTNAAYVWKVYDSDPNTSAEWLAAAIDALQAGAESVIV